MGKLRCKPVKPLQGFIGPQMSHPLLGHMPQNQLFRQPNDRWENQIETAWEWWAMKDLNLRPLACEASALTTELIARIKWSPTEKRVGRYIRQQRDLFFVTEGSVNCKRRPI